MVWTGVVFLLMHHVIITIGRPNIPVTAVCGTDGRTYKDEEDLRLAQIEEADLQLLYLGPCLRAVQESLRQNLKPYQRDDPINDYHLKVSLPGVEMEYVGSQPEISEKLTPDFENFTRIGKLRGGLGSIWVYDPTLRVSNRPSYHKIYHHFYQPYALHKMPYYTSNQPTYLPTFYKPTYYPYNQQSYRPSYKPSYKMFYESPYQQKYSSDFKPTYASNSQLNHPYHYHHQPKGYYIPHNDQSFNRIYHPEYLLHKYDWKHDRNGWKENGNKQRIYIGDIPNGNEANVVNMENISEENLQGTTKYIEGSNPNNDGYNTESSFVNIPKDYQKKYVGDSWEVTSNGFDSFVTPLTLDNNEQSMRYNSNHSMLYKPRYKFNGDPNRGMYLKTFGEVYDSLYRPPKATPIYSEDHKLDNLDRYRYPSFGPTYHRFKDYFPEGVHHLSHFNLVDKGNLHLKSIPSSLAGDLFALTESVLSGLDGNLFVSQESTPPNLASNLNVTPESILLSSEDGNFLSQFTHPESEGNLSEPISTILKDKTPPASILPPELKDNSASNSIPPGSQDIHSILGDNEGGSTGIILILLGDLPYNLKNNTGDSVDFSLNSLARDVLHGWEINTESTPPSINSYTENVIPIFQDHKGGSIDPSFNLSTGDVPIGLKDNTRGTTDSSLYPPPGEIKLLQESAEGSLDLSLNPPIKDVLDGLENNIGVNTDSSVNPPTSDVLVDFEDNRGGVTDSFLNSHSESILSVLEDNGGGGTDFYLNHPPETILPGLEDNIELKTDSSVNSLTEDVFSGLEDNKEVGTDPSINPAPETILSGLEDNIGLITDSSVNSSTGDVLSGLEDNRGGGTDPSINPPPETIHSALEDYIEFITESSGNFSTRDVPIGLEDNRGGVREPSMNPPPETIPSGLEDSIEFITDTSINPSTSDVPLGLEDNTGGSRNPSLNRPPENKLPDLQDEMERSTDPTLNLYLVDMPSSLEDDADDSINSSLDPPFINTSLIFKDDKSESVDSPTGSVGDSLVDNSSRNMNFSSPGYITTSLGGNTESNLDPSLIYTSGDVPLGLENDTRGGRDRDLSQNHPLKDVFPGLQDDMGRSTDTFLNSSVEDVPSGLQDDVKESMDTSNNTPSGYLTSDLEDDSEDILNSVSNNLSGNMLSDFDYPVNVMEENLKHHIGINEEGKSYLNSDLTYLYTLPDYYLIDPEFLTKVIGTGTGLGSSLSDEGLDDADEGYVEDSVERGIQGNVLYSVIGDHVFNANGSLGLKGNNGVNSGRVWVKVPETIIAVDSYEIIGEGSSYEHIFRDSVENNEVFPESEYTDVPTKDIQQYTDNEVSASLDDNLSSHDYQHQHLGGVVYDEPCDIENWFKK